MLLDRENTVLAVAGQASHGVGTVWHAEEGVGVRSGHIAVGDRRAGAPSGDEDISSHLATAGGAEGRLDAECEVAGARAQARVVGRFAWRLLHCAAALALVDLHSTVELSRRGRVRGCELKGSHSQS